MGVGVGGRFPVLGVPQRFLLHYKDRSNSQVISPVALPSNLAYKSPNQLS